MFFTEPIVTWLSLLSGFSDALIFTFLQSFTPVYEQWGFGVIGVSLAFIPLLLGYILSYLSYLPSIHHFRKIRRTKPGTLAPEARLWWLLFRKCYPSTFSQLGEIKGTHNRHSCSPRNNRHVRLRLDLPGPRLWNSLDSNHDLLLHGRNGKCKVPSSLPFNAQSNSPL